MIKWMLNLLRRACGTRYLLEDTRYLHEQITALHEKIDIYHRAMFANQISLANAQGGTRDLSTPWSNRKHVILHNTEAGRLCFELEASGSGEPAIVCSIPKAGTYYVAAALDYMGYKRLNIGGSGEYTLNDYRYVAAPSSYAETNGFSAMIRWDLPFTIQAKLVRPGQYSLNHRWGEQLRLACESGKIIFIVRDLRHIIVSATRMKHRKDFADFQEAYCTPGNVIETILQDAVIFSSALTIADLMHEPNACLVRFEELASGDRGKMEPSVQALSRATGLDAEQVFAAVLQASNSKERSWSYTGQHSTLDGKWTREVEAAFAAKGGDILNERLGYPREYAPLA